jgi:hypothetical protein
MFLICGVLAFVACRDGSSGEDKQDASTSPGGHAGATGGSSGSAGGSAGAASAAGSGGTGSNADSGAGSNGGVSGNAGADGGVVTAPMDCTNASFCETFENYPAVTTIADKQKFGPWHAALQKGATMELDGKHKLSGSNALHVHLDNAVTSGGRLFADGNQPIFSGKPTHLYGRMMMYIDPNGTSVHWTFFGATGTAEPSSPVAGKYASYIMSSLPKKGVNTYSFVYGLSAPEGYHDCSSQSDTAMPSTWACVAFEMDSVTRKLRMYKDSTAAPILAVDDHGKGCVAPTMVTSPWYGPVINQLFVGAWSFHAMNAPLDVWIDDVVVDTKPVPCTAL